MAEALWKPNATVAALCQRDGKYLLVRERIDGVEVYNQPAGHLEPGESLIDAVVREALEETGYRFEPTALQGIYRYAPSAGATTTFLRFLFRGEAGARVATELDPEIIAAEWMSYDQVVACSDRHRTPMVLQCIEDSGRGPGYPLDIISREFA